VGAAVAPAGMGAAERAELLTQRPVPVRLGRLVALGGAVLPDQPVCPPLRHAEHPLQVFDGAAPAGRAVSSTCQRSPTACRHGRAASASSGVNRSTQR
jgi:hypothetical protein